ncbi:hypothetical protein, partial [Catenovulum sediminis]
MYFAAAIADYGFTGKYRPKHYVPFKVPVYDEILDTYRKTEYNALVAAGEQNLTPPETQYQY